MRCRSRATPAHTGEPVESETIDGLDEHEQNDDWLQRKHEGVLENQRLRTEVAAAYHCVHGLLPTNERIVLLGHPFSAE